MQSPADLADCADGSLNFFHLRNLRDLREMNYLYSTKKTGSGIGLSLSRQIMRVHDGRISVKSKVGEGTEFQLKF